MGANNADITIIMMSLAHAAICLLTRLHLAFVHIAWILLLVLTVDLSLEKSPFRIQLVHCALHFIGSHTSLNWLSLPSGRIDSLGTKSSSNPQALDSVNTAAKADINEKCQAHQDLLESSPKVITCCRKAGGDLDEAPLRHLFEVRYFV